MCKCEGLGELLMYCRRCSEGLGRRVVLRSVGRLKLMEMSEEMCKGCE